MCRKPIIAALVLSGLAALAITPHLSLFGPNSPEITPATLGAALWVEPSRPGGYVTNGGTATLKNFTSVGVFHDLTNQTPSGFPTLRTGLNGLQALAFPTTVNLVNQLYTTTTATQEMFLVWAVTNTSASFAFVGYTAPASNHSILAGGGLIQMKMGGATSATLANTTSLENKFYVLDLVYTGLNSTGYTNGVQGVASFNLIATNINGIIFGNTHAISLLSFFAWTNRVLTTAQRLAAYQYCTNRFGVMP